MAEPAYDVVCLGSCCWDILGICEEYPQLDEKRPLTELAECGGGQAATAATAIASLGGRVAFIGRIGDDEYGRKIRRDFEEQGVDVSWGLGVVPGARSQFAFCVAEAGTGRRAIFWRPPSTGQIEPGELDVERALSCRCVLIDGHHVKAGIALAEAASERGIPVVTDLERPREGLERLLELSAYPVLPARFAMQLAGCSDLLAAGRALAERLDGILVVTAGPDGSYAFLEKSIHHQPAFSIQPVVDTTGAGDVYHGAFALAIARGASVKQAMRYASAAAAVSCMALGGRGNLPTERVVAELLERGESTG